MFKKTAYIFVFAFIIFSFLTRPVKAQEFNFEKAYQDYTFTIDQYSQSFSEYQKAKDFYLKNQTLTLKEEARKKTLVMLRNRDELERVYLNALRLKIIELKGLTGDEKNNIISKLDSEIEWYKNHKENYKDTDVLEDLFNKSKESESRYETHTTPISYDSLYNISLGEVVGIKNDHEEVYVAIKKELDGEVSKGTLRLDPFNRWLTDIDLVIQNLKANETKSKEEIDKIYSQNYTNPSNSFREASAVLLSSKSLLGQLNSFLHELLTSFNAQLQSQNLTK